MALKTPKWEGLNLSLKSTQHAFSLPYWVIVCSSQQIPSCLEFCLVFNKYGISVNLPYLLLS